jgi:hypothetical protein
MCYRMDVYATVLCYIYPSLNLFIHYLKSQGSVCLLRRNPAGFEVLTAVVMEIQILRDVMPFQLLSG